MKGIGGLVDIDAFAELVLSLFSENSNNLVQSLFAVMSSGNEMSREELKLVGKAISKDLNSLAKGSKRLSLDEFKSLLCNNSLIPLVEKAIAIEKSYDIQEEYETICNWLRENCTGFSDLFRSRLQSANVLNKQWEERISKFEHIVSSNDHSHMCNLAYDNSNLYDIQDTLDTVSYTHLTLPTICSV
eukprot:TRINITY_DN13711_c0_g1_i2.p1 TRINITY_DN13711_c0_g1~~TRINITY_DN13711_c0_g1_i2.p1  ORF type:complete len:187 (-),score=24.65 TRINITY_DN13711_c0_g1_i2:43-603(-)